MITANTLVYSDQIVPKRKKETVPPQYILTKGGTAFGIITGQPEITGWPPF
ncbi:hypothetical protein [Paenibacillus sp. FSL K6-2524]|uniref:hypothetical protein n=1 Tax=Paenibacillus sp. FSL K6-2524 TaxID=2954516 RepID=UPI0030F68463